MKKNELISKIAKDAGLTKKQAAAAFDACMNGIVDELVAGNGVQISGFGTFNVKEVPAHTGRNPRTNETLEIPASRRVTFAAGKTLKKKING